MSTKTWWKWVGTPQHEHGRATYYCGTVNETTVSLPNFEQAFALAMAIEAQAQSVRLEAAERLAADRLEQMNADRKQALVWRDQAELYEQVRKFSPREFQALWTKNVTSGAMFDDLVRAAIASEANL